jgi:hypothetical protein
MGQKARAGYFLGILSPSAVAGSFLFVLSVPTYRALMPGLGWIDAVYQTVGVMSTVGIVVTPTSPAARAFTALLNLVSLGVAAAVIAEIGEKRRATSRALLRQGSRPPTLASEAAQTALSAFPTLLLTTFVLSYLEGWGMGLSLYFSITCGTGLGMDGSVEPRTPMGRLVTSMYVMAQLACMCSFCSVFGEWIKIKVQQALAAQGDGIVSGMVGGGGGAPSDKE